MSSSNSVIAMAESFEQNFPRVAAVGKHLPMCGMIVGALTAITAPFLWPTAFELLLNSDIKQALFQDNMFWINDAYDWIMVPVGIPLGAICGLSMQLTLETMTSSSNSKQSKSLPLLGLLVVLSIIYFTYCKEDIEEYMWYERMDYVTGEVKYINASTKAVSKDPAVYYTSQRLRQDVGIGKGTTLMTMLRDAYKPFQKISLPQRENNVIPLAQPISATMIENYEELYTLIDILLRLEYLDAQSSSMQRSDELKSLEKLTVEKYNLSLNSMRMILSDALKLVVATKSNRQGDIYSNSLSVMSRSQEKKVAISLLCSNIEHFELEYCKAFNQTDFFKKNKQFPIVFAVQMIGMCLLGLILIRPKK